VSIRKSTICDDQYCIRFSRIVESSIKVGIIASFIVVNLIENHFDLSLSLSLSRSFIIS